MFWKLKFLEVIVKNVIFYHICTSFPNKSKTKQGNINVFDYKLSTDSLNLENKIFNRLRYYKYDKLIFENYLVFYLLRHLNIYIL